MFYVSDHQCLWQFRLQLSSIFAQCVPRHREGETVVMVVLPRNETNDELSLALAAITRRLKQHDQC